MSTGRYIDKICITAVSLTLALTVLFMCGGSLGIASAAKSMKYESTLFDTSFVHKIDIVMDDWDEFIEGCENEEYGSCTVVIDGEQHKNTAIRAKGNTSLSSVRSAGSQRYSFKLEFDHYEEGRSCDGLDKLCLNNLIQDNTMMKDYIVYRLMNEFGADSPLCSFAYITVNGEDWGLYLAVEGVEESFLSRSYGSDAGELYKPDSMSFGGGRGNGKDFNMDDFDFGEFNGQEEKAESTGQQNTDAPQMPGNMPGDFAPGNMPQMQGGFDPGDMQMPGGGFAPGNMPQMPNGDFDPGNVPQMQGEFAPGNMPQMQGGFDPGDMPQMPNGDFAPDNVPQMPGDDPIGEAPQGADSDGKQGGFTGFGGGFGGMGSDDVKLKYIDDAPESYSNIFSSAKTDVSSADKARLIAALKRLSEYSELEDTLDIDEVLRYFVVHNFVCNGDSYTGNMIHNYYLHEKDGRLGMIPWDYNLAFGTFQGGSASDAVNASIDSPVSGGNADDRPMVGWIFSDEAYTKQYHELFAEFLEEYFTDGELASLIEKTAEMLRPYVESDPTKFCTAEEFERGVTALSEFVTLRAEAVGRQLSGDSTPVDTSGLELSEMGTMGRGMGSPDMGGASMKPQMNGLGKPGEASEVSGSDAGKPAGAPDKPANGREEQGGRTGMSRPDGETGFDPFGRKTPGSSAASETEKWLYVAVSVLVLAVGLFAAWKKKY